VVDYSSEVTIDWLFERCIPVPFSGCWIWEGALIKQGYASWGRMRGGKQNGRTYLGHRTAYELVKGPIPAGMHVDHLCGVKCCINPDHLEAVPPRTNLRRALRPDSAWVDAITHCPQGHEYTAENIYQHPKGYIVCCQCHALANRKYRAKQRT